jgi:hypothetical protein
MQSTPRARGTAERPFALIATFVLALAMAAPQLVAQGAGGAGAAPSFTWGLENIKVNWFGIVPTGPILWLRYGSLGLVEGRRSDIEGKFGIGYENFPISRDETTRDPLLPDKVEQAQKAEPIVDMPDFQFELGFRQGIIPLEDRRDLLALYTSLHTRFAHNFGQSKTSAFPDRNDELMASLVLGLKFANDGRNGHGLRSGYKAFVEGELGPALLSAQRTDFVRLVAEWLQYVPLFDLPGERNVLSSYLALRANAKYIVGNQVPLFMLEATDVRGYPIDLDTQLRASASAEIRLDLPSLLGESSIFPILFAFADAGWYAGWNDLDAGSSWTGSLGPLASVGAGFAIDVFAFARPVVWVGLPLVNADSKGKDIIGTKTVKIGFGFDLALR